MKRVTGVDFAVSVSGRQDGDSAQLISNNSRILEKLDWSPKYDDIELICRSAYEWERNLATIYLCSALTNSSHQS
ncbi:MAG: hypothetical protein R2827_13665 [Bdellovibrionales bacterium]